MPRGRGSKVQQTVSVNQKLNANTNSEYPQYCDSAETECKPYFIYQAGAYQRDPDNTNVPFFSPLLARHCSGNLCILASWGTQAHVPTPFTSPVIYVNKYTNCNHGIIEHTQMIHK